MRHAHLFALSCHAAACPAAASSPALMSRTLAAAKSASAVSAAFLSRVASSSTPFAHFSVASRCWRAASAAVAVPSLAAWISASACCSHASCRCASW